MEKVILGVHGLGNKPPKQLIEDWWATAIYEGLGRIGYKGRTPKFEMVYWADILYDKPLDPNETDVNSPYYLDEPYVKASKDFPLVNRSLRIAINEFISSQLNRFFLNKDYSLNYRNVVNNLVKEYLRDFDVYFKKECTPEDSEDCRVKEIINQRLRDAINKYHDHEIILIGHSMGSVITFDVLNFELPPKSVHTYITMGAPLGLPVVLSKIAAEQRLRPNDDRIMNSPDAIKNNWYNFSDLLDLVSFNFQLNDDFSPNKDGIMVEDFIISNDYEVEGERNPHKSFGYLRAKEFSETLKKLIVADQTLENSRLDDMSINMAKNVWNSIKKPLRVDKDT